MKILRNPWQESLYCFSCLAFLSFTNTEYSVAEASAKKERHAVHCTAVAVPGENYFNSKKNYFFVEVEAIRSIPPNNTTR